MKKIILKSLACLFALALMVSCSNDETDTVVPKSSAAATAVTPSTARGSFWDGTLGVLDSNGNPQLTVDPSLVIADFEATLQKEGNDTDLITVSIEKKYPTNSTSLDPGYMLIGSDGKGTSIGLMLTLAGTSFTLGGGDETTSVSCRGCATGCNLSFLLVDGHKYPYCNENGCGEFCTKSESSFN